MCHKRRRGLTLILWMTSGVVSPSLAHSQNFFPIAVATPASAGTSATEHRTYSVGQPHLGALLNPVPLDASAYFTVRNQRNFGTPELIDVLEAAGREVHARHGESPKIHVGDLSYQHGGPIGQHVSHQSGRDADVSYYLKTGHDPDRFKRATRLNLDAERTWTFIEALLVSGHTKMIFSDREIIAALRKEAEARPNANLAQIRQWFDGEADGGRPILRHLKGHANHIHLRVYAPQSAITVEALGEGKLGSKVRQTIAMAHEFRTKRGVKAATDVGCDEDERRTHITPKAAPPALVQDPSLDPGFDPQDLDKLLSDAQNHTQSSTSRARVRSRIARSKARQARRRARAARVRWYHRHPNRLAHHP